MQKVNYLWGLLRIGLGWIFFWAFLDKVFGLGFATKTESAWLAGGSPTTGFLKFAAKGPFAEIFQGLAGSAVVDWLFMLGLLFIGLALMLGIGVKLASYAGALLVFLMWLAVLPPEHNPILDDHIVYGLVLLVLPIIDAGQYIGLGKWWSSTNLVKNHSYLK